MKKIENECKGCSNGDQNNCFNGLVPHITETDSCPCVNCLVKMICENQCKDFIKYLTLSYRPIKRDDKNGK